MGSGGSWNPKDWSVGGKKPFESGGSFMNTATPAGWLGFDFNDPTGKRGAADAAERAAMAQMAEAREQRRVIMEQGTKNQQLAMALAEATPQELAALDRSYQAADQALGREEKLVAAIDPALMEASSQVLKLLRGESADINKPMTDMRQMKRQNLVNSLRAKYGPGAEESSIGRKTLSDFDMETDSLFSANQRNALNDAFGIASADFGGRLTRGIGAVGTAGQGYSALQERKLNTQMNTGNALIAALSGTAPAMIQSAGAPYMGDMVRAQGQQAVFNTLLNGGIQYATAQAGGGKKT